MRALAPTMLSSYSATVPSHIDSNIQLNNNNQKRPKSSIQISTNDSTRCVQVVLIELMLKFIF